MIKILNALTPILFVVTFSALAGQEGGGGLPIIEPPSDPFLYICKTTLAEQRTIGSHTCYAEMVSEYRFSNKDLNPNDHTPKINIETSSADNWVKGHTWNGCSVEKRFLDGQRIGLTFGRNADNSSNVQLDVTAVRNGDDDIITASSTSMVNFSQKTIEANTDLTHFPSGNGNGRRHHFGSKDGVY